jgi:uncharacterized protein YbcC (UPF0753/DUF2309 family)
MQSLHEGRRMHHTPLQLGVFIEASRDAIETVMSQHEVVRQLVNNGWLHLLRIVSESHHVELHRNKSWHLVQSSSEPSAQR